MPKSYSYVWNLEVKNNLFNNASEEGYKVCSLEGTSSFKDMFHTMLSLIIIEFERL